MCTADNADAGGGAFDATAGRGFGSAPRALAMASAALDYLNAAAPLSLPVQPENRQAAKVPTRRAICGLALRGSGVADGVLGRRNPTRP